MWPSQVLCQLRIIPISDLFCHKIAITANSCSGLLVTYIGLYYELLPLILVEPVIPIPWVFNRYSYKLPVLKAKICYLKEVLPTEHGFLAKQMLSVQTYLSRNYWKVSRGPMVVMISGV